MPVRPTNRQPSKRKPSGPTKAEQERLQQEFDDQVQCAVAQVIDEEHFRRAMLVRLCDGATKLLEVRDSDKDFQEPIKTAYGDAISAMLARIERIANSDKPAYFLCSKCGE